MRQRQDLNFSTVNASMMIGIKMNEEKGFIHTFFETKFTNIFDFFVDQGNVGGMWNEKTFFTFSF